MALLDALLNGTLVPQNFGLPPEVLPWQQPQAAPAQPQKLPPPEMEPTAPKAAAPRPDFGAGHSELGTILQGIFGNGVIGGLGKAISANTAQGATVDRQNKTYDALIEKGLDAQTAEMVVRNPDIAKSIIPQLFGTSGPPEIVKIPGAYGQEQSVVWNPRTRKYDPVSSVMSGGAQQPMVQPGLESAPGGSNAAAAPATAPASATPLVIPGASDQGPAPAPASPAPPASQGSGQYIIGNAVPKAPDGYVHRLAEDGSGYLYSHDGRPLFESKAEADARAKATEKRATDRVDQEQQMQGVGNIIADARNLTKSPGFDDGLYLSQFRVDVPFIGQVNPVGGPMRIVDRDNPANSINDEIGAIQNRLNLVVGRAYLKGQGQVSNFERQMVADAIGSLASATSKADFQMRLSSVERMIEDMNSGKKLEGKNYNARPTEAEIRDSVNLNGPYGAQFKPGAVQALAQKYRVDEADMQDYLNKLFLRTQGR